MHRVSITLIFIRPWVLEDVWPGHCGACQWDELGASPSAWLTGIQWSCYKVIYGIQEV